MDGDTATFDWEGHDAESPTYADDDQLHAPLDGHDDLTAGTTRTTTTSTTTACERIVAPGPLPHALIGPGRRCSGSRCGRARRIRPMSPGLGRAAAVPLVQRFSAAGPVPAVGMLVGPGGTGKSGALRAVAAARSAAGSVASSCGAAGSVRSARSGPPARPVRGTPPRRSRVDARRPAGGHGRAGRRRPVAGPRPARARWSTWRSTRRSGWGPVPAAGPGPGRAPRRRPAARPLLPAGAGPAGRAGGGRPAAGTARAPLRGRAGQHPRRTARRPAHRRPRRRGRRCEPRPAPAGGAPRAQLAGVGPHQPGRAGGPSRPRPAAPPRPAAGTGGAAGPGGSGPAGGAVGGGTARPGPARGPGGGPPPRRGRRRRPRGAGRRRARRARRPAPPGGRRLGPRRAHPGGAGGRRGACGRRPGRAGTGPVGVRRPPLAGAPHRRRPGWLPSWPPASSSWANPERALAWFRRAVALDGDRVEGRLGLLRALVAAGDAEGTRREVDVARRASRAALDLRAHVRRAVAALFAGQGLWAEAALQLAEAPADEFWSTQRQLCELLAGARRPLRRRRPGPRGSVAPRSGRSPSGPATPIRPGASVAGWSRRWPRRWRRPPPPRGGTGAAASAAVRDLVALCEVIEAPPDAAANLVEIGAVTALALGELDVARRLLELARPVGLRGHRVGPLAAWVDLRRGAATPDPAEAAAPGDRRRRGPRRRR